MIAFFNDLLDACGLDPREVALLRHKQAACRLWRRDKAAFELYISTQTRESKWAAQFARPSWANFVAEPKGGSLFVGLYRADLDDPRKIHSHSPLDDEPLNPETDDLYRLEAMKELSGLRAKLRIDWGEAYRHWVQNADRKNKPLTTPLRLEDLRFPQGDERRSTPGV